MRCLYGEPVDPPKPALEKCACPRCCGGDQKFWYRVRPYNWAHGAHSSVRSGTSYTIEQVRTIATTRCLEDATLVADALNSAKKAERKIAQLEGEVTRMKGCVGLTLEQVRQAFVAEASVHCRWSAARKNVVDFYQAVIERLKNL